MQRRFSLATVILASLLWAPGVGAQNFAVDEGTFLLFENGREVGTETFTIRRAGTGEEARWIARGIVEFSGSAGSWSMAPALEAQGDRLTLAAYQLKVSGDQEEEIYVSLSGRRYLAKVVSDEGEQMREFRAVPGLLLLEDGVAHQYFLLRPYLEGEGTTLTALIPRRSRQIRMRVVSVGTETISLPGGVSVPARHFRLEAGEDSREVWLDEQDRVVRVQIPATGFRADRQDLR
jgi:hypothetical protein